METRTHRPRFWVALQPSIVRLYKVAGLIALTAILVGLIGFLVVNVFYFFDHSWVRPVILTQDHHKVVEASTQLADAKLRVSQLATDKLEFEVKLAEVERTVASANTFLTDVGTLADGMKTIDQALLRREIDRVKLERDNALGSKVTAQRNLESLKLRVAEQEKLVARLSASPYLKALDHRVVLAFIPYDNKHKKVGVKLYGCSWGIVACSSVGKITAIHETEVTNQHPNNDSTFRGQLVEIDVSEWGANQGVLFAGGKPLWLF